MLANYVSAKLDSKGHAIFKGKRDMLLFAFRSCSERRRFRQAQVTYWPRNVIYIRHIAQEGKIEMH